MKKLILIIFFLFFSLPVFAASLYFYPLNQKVFPLGREFSVQLMLHPVSEDVNAVEGKITFDKNILELKRISEGNSIVPFFTEKPALNEKGEIVFAGIIPGGFSGFKNFLTSKVEPGKILDLTFIARKESVTSIEIKDATVLLNDGKGTKAGLSLSNLTFSISKTATSEEEKLEDKDAPESFTPELGQNQNMFDNKWFVAFVTQDKGSGIDSYYVYESRMWGAGIKENEWIKTESPYLLNDQELHSYIYVKAKDLAGNERIASLAPKYPIPFYQNYLFWGIMILIALGVIYFTFKKFKKEK